MVKTFNARTTGDLDLYVNNWLYEMKRKGYYLVAITQAQFKDGFFIITVGIEQSPNTKRTREK